MIDGITRDILEQRDNIENQETRIFNNNREKYIKNLEKQLEAYENMRKELIKEFNFYETTEWGIKGYEILEKFRNILNKVGGSDE